MPEPANPPANSSDSDPQELSADDLADALAAADRSELDGSGDEFHQRFAALTPSVSAAPQAATNPILASSLLDLVESRAASPAPPERSAAPPIPTPPCDPAGLTWHQAEGRPEVSAPLQHLPDGLNLTDDFPEPLRFDAAARRLSYRGFMSASSFRYLQQLSKDPAYLQAIEHLSIRTADALAGRAHRRIWLWVAVALIAAAGVVVWLRVHGLHG